MCGIVGVFGSVSTPVLEKMCNSMVYRGPDGYGLWVSNDNKVGFAHRRLAIIDLSTKASQPMHTQDGFLHVVFNGEIYNHLELRSILQKENFQFHSDHSDTEILLHGYRAWGIEGLLNRLQGMFAFALYDQQERSLFLVRDRVGVKPLYFTWAKGNLLFSSEIKALLEHPDVPRELEQSGMYHYLSFMASPVPLTLFKGIYKLPAGHWFQINQDGSSKTKQWWSAVPGKGTDNQEISKLSFKSQEEYYVQGIRDRLENAVKMRMVSDVPVGVFLSGGIDSTTVLSLMSRFANKPVNTFSIGFSDHPEMNELDYAKYASHEYGSIHHELLISENDVFPIVEDMIFHQDEPIADWVCIPLYFVSRLAKDAGVKVVQLGEGADEQFCGYPYYMQMLNWHKRFWKPFCKTPVAFQYIAAYFASRLASMRYSLAPHADMVRRASRNGQMFWTGSPVFWELLKEKFISHKELAHQETESELKMIELGLLSKDYYKFDSANVVNSWMTSFDQKYPNQDQLTRMIYAEFQLRLPELLLMRVDKMTMAHSIEARVPFLDSNLIDFSMNIPSNIKIKGNHVKLLLKKAVRGIIPDKIIDRPKQGFGAPMCHWLRGSLGKYIESRLLNSRLFYEPWFNINFVKQLLETHRKGNDRAVQIWTFYNLAAWYDYWIENKRI